jgi:SAM-dependent methyltransferase
MGERLLLYPVREYPGVGKDDPIRHYTKPIFGKLYRRRVEMCLAELKSGGDVLEVGFGSGVTFPNLARKYGRVWGLDPGVDIELVSAFWSTRGVRANLRAGSVLEMPFADDSMDSVLMISILEHQRPDELPRAFAEVRRVLRPGGQVVYGVPIDRLATRVAFRLLGYDIRRHHFSTERDVRSAASAFLEPVRYQDLRSPLGLAVDHVATLVRRTDSGGSI